MLRYRETSSSLGIVREDFTQEVKLALGLEDELRWVAEREESEQHSGRNNLELGKRDYVNKVMVRGSLFTKTRWGPSGDGGRDVRRL